MNIRFPFPDRKLSANSRVAHRWATPFKSYRDGIFKALGLDDSLIKRTIIERGEIEKDGAIYVNLKEIQ